MKIFLIFLSFLFFSPNLIGQEGFQYYSKKDKVTIPFQFINNLIFIPLKVNGVDLTFLLDTGVEESILFSLEDKEELKFNNVEKIKLRGLGNSDFIEGLKSSGNLVVFKDDIVDQKHDIYIILDEEFNFSGSVGIPVNGIIGYQFFKNFKVEINYLSQKIYIHNPSKEIKKRKMNKFLEVDIFFHNNKPYYSTLFEFDNQKVDGKLLLDIGNSDAFWFFSNRIKSYTFSNQSFEDFLGKGFNGDIFGKRTKLNSFSFEDFRFKNPYVAIPDSTSLSNIKWAESRIGSIGGEVFKRFNIIFDYKNSKLYLKKNKKFNDPFEYNMSGIEINHAGLQWIQEEVKMNVLTRDQTSYENITKGSDSFKYKFVLKPIYVIANIRKDSPADLCGLKKGDIIVSINSHGTDRYSLQEVNNLLKSQEGKKIIFEVDRGNRRMKFTFYLKSIL
ncbi:PDZ domain-containing protein [Flavobacterium piscinae]|uniref:PDZ domain-containing protein n=1 Tax=Flavobacterium piscinae TaxID=2506424 RepID=A0A4Q1KNK8_9FLAO|nr:PDZ domain-containing protein [Flavobacterium piscinae]